MKKLLKIGLGLVLALIVISVIFGKKSAPTSPTSSNVVTEASTAPAPETQKPVETVSATAAALFSAYDKNEVAADQKYKGKAVAVSGTVQSIDKDAFDNIVVRLKSGNEFMPVNAYLSKEHEALAASLEKGRKVTWVCEGAGRLIGSPILRGCIPA
ncbi:OB-fold protein [Burkholderia stagnalis]|uniref:Uncharacterized protein n=1 Tax=Burkholderia stagnalis TaxID=1503054 RepID=A0A104QDY3_9BURK|nr:hypothetical protein [Burkholderia stagnalis]AOK57257.1 hypothetical protein WT74_32175 [Burkholderia stagnalis]KVN71984.1 hypothetical protein WT15_27715 [Burkholderia stagnalis]KVZ13570.1 hypothetical protein WT35_13660 [Burkholderia stagnalis]KWA52197.1 hypothetical protein WT44_31445 [Burkholderia stagnalis]KWA57399.1 hypothetical protein WT42_08710 [Burkholderia stagnalis]